MTDKALISDLTWRSLEMQRKAFPDMPHFVAPDDIPSLLRPTTRNAGFDLHVESLAVIADNEQAFRDFIGLCKKRQMILHVREVGNMFLCKPNLSVDAMVTHWRKARRNGAAKAGGDAKADKSEREFWEGFTKIKDRWHLSVKSKDLLKEAKIGHHDTVRVNLGYTRWEWRRLTDAKRERVLKQKEKEYRDAQRI